MMTTITAKQTNDQQGESNFTHESYEAANKAAKANPGVVFTSDAGNGWTHQVHYCESRRRLIHQSINPDGWLL